MTLGPFLKLTSQELSKKPSFDPNNAFNPFIQSLFYLVSNVFWGTLYRVFLENGYRWPNTNPVSQGNHGCFEPK